jgi:hypothetical protein
MAEVEPGTPHVDIGGYLLGTLTPAEHDAFEAHLATCDRCRRELTELGDLPGLLAQADDEPVRVPAGLESRVLGAIAAEPARRTRDEAPVIRLGPRRRGLGWLPAWAPAAALAVVVAFAAGLGAGRVLPTGQPAPVHQPPAAATIRLVGANGSTGSGTATVRDTPGGRSIELTVQDLPAPPPGHFYTCWLVAPDDTLQHQDRVSVGSFTTDGARPVTLRWETAADLGRYPSLGVTLEPDNGNPLHQGPKVLTAA